ncbi:MAG: transporter substrate-binding domain-containing protein, partial [Burkholderiales bacterium]|nr:transporter substrate-binding domain-containing protein [Burkholderiales bacterium]
MRNVILILSTAASLLVPAFASASDTLDKVRRTQTIVIGIRETPPFSFTDANKQPMGYSVDLCLKIVEAVKKELKLPNLKTQFYPI